MPHRKAERRGATLATFAVAGGHVLLGLLGLNDRLSYTQPSVYDLLQAAQHDEFWGPLHLVIGVGLVVGVKHPSMLDRGIALVRRDYKGHAEVWLCNVSFAVMLTWGFFNLLSGVSAVRPVALGAPVLALVVALGSHLLANAWMRIKGYATEGR